MTWWGKVECLVGNEKPSEACTRQPDLCDFALLRLPFARHVFHLLTKLGVEPPPNNDSESLITIFHLISHS